MPKRKQKRPESPRWLVYLPRWMSYDNKARFMTSASPLEFSANISYARRYTESQARRIEDRMWLTQGVVAIREREAYDDQAGLIDTSLVTDDD